MPIVRIGKLRQTLAMGRVWTMCCLVLFAAQARAAGPGDNPGFCAGFLASQSDRYASMMRTHEEVILRAFDRHRQTAPADGLGFTEWIHVGVQAAQEKSSPGYRDTVVRCRTLIETIAQK